MSKELKTYILGIDLGVQSLGWAAIETSDGYPLGLLDAGVRCWELSNASATDINMGKENPPGQERRQARQMRRQLFRRAQRLRRTCRALQDIGLLPPGRWNSRARKEVFDAIDQKAKDWLRQNIPDLAHDPLLDHTFVYHLRAAALDHELPPDLLARVFFHLAQRRGFLSNRRTTRDEKEEGEVKQAIATLEQDIQASGCRTLGEYFAKLNPHQQRIRGRWTSRKMYQQEFELICSAQVPWHPQALNTSNQAKIHKAIFFQRPLKSQKHLIGRCALEVFQIKQGADQTLVVRRRRAPMACLEAQRVRYMQRINDLEVISPSGEMRRLTAEEREKLYALAESKEKLSFPQVKKALGIPTGKKGADWEFNLQKGGEKELPGNKTAATLRGILGDKVWDAMGEADQKRLVDTILAYLHPQALCQHLETVWKFDHSTAAKLADVTLEKGYHSFSRRALRKLIPRLRQGERLNEAIKKLYGGTQLTTPVDDFLPPLTSVMPELRNPLLIRALTELRKVVNALVRKYGKPTLVRIELARDLKRGRKERERLAERMRAQEKRRKAAAEFIEQTFSRKATPTDIEKYLLAEECNWKCPYTGKCISVQSLLGDTPQFDIEHIWPYDRSLDNSYANKTLCYHEENRNVKRDHTPFEAYASDPQRWDQILQRVKEFNGPFAREKLRRFLAEELPSGFAQRHLSDTRWIAKAAADYVGYLYGGRIDAAGRQRVFTVTGGLTAIIRRALNLNVILGSEDEKSRADHRHHAIDAIAIALTDSSLVQRLSYIARQLLLTSARTAIQLEEPWQGFNDQAKCAVLGIVVSHRVDRRLSGPLHEQTNYAPPVAEGKTKVRKLLENLSPSEVDEIIDSKIRELVRAKLNQLGKKKPKEVFKDPSNLPILHGRNGHAVPVKSVRIWVSAGTIPLGKGHRVRYVKPGNNHHIEIYAVLDENGQAIKYQGKCVTLFEATQRKRRGLPVICKDHGPNTRFAFTLAKNECIQWLNEEQETQLLRVVRIADNDIEFRLLYDARPSTLVKGKERIRASYTRLFRCCARKVLITPLGEVLPAND